MTAPLNVCIELLQLILLYIAHVIKLMAAEENNFTRFAYHCSYFSALVRQHHFHHCLCQWENHFVRLVPVIRSHLFDTYRLINCSCDCFVRVHPSESKWKRSKMKGKQHVSQRLVCNYTFNFQQMPIKTLAHSECERHSPPSIPNRSFLLLLSMDCCPVRSCVKLFCMLEKSIDGQKATQTHKINTVS